MRSRSVPLVLALALVVLLAGCAAPLQADGGADAGADDADGPTIDVSGTGTASADADLAVVRVSVIARGDSADAVRGQVATDAESMRAALRDAGVPEDAVTTESFRVSPRYDRVNDTRELVGYEAVHAFRIEVAPDRAGEVVDVAVSGGADRVDGVGFTLTDETRAELREQALTEAVESARADADAIAGAAGLTVTGVDSASTSQDFSPIFQDRVAEAGGDAAATSFEPGPVTVSATVSVTYAAEQSN